MPQPAPARRPPDGIPHCDIDPFPLHFLRDPHPAHETLREAGPIVWLEKYGAYAAARHAEVRQILGDPVTFCSSQGVGLSDFQREKPWRPPSGCSSATRPSMTERAPSSIAPYQRR